MADELSQSDFDKTIESLKEDLVKSSKETRESIGEAVGAASASFGNMLEQTTKSLMFASRRSTEMLQQTISAQFLVHRQLAFQQQDEAQETLTGLLGIATKQVDQTEKAQQAQEEPQKKSIFLLTNLSNAMGALVTLSSVNQLAATERRREEKRSSDALLGAISELGDGFDKFKSGLRDLLGLATNPLALVGAILGVAAGAVAGLFIKAKQAAGLLKLGTLLKTMFKPLAVLFGPRSRLGQAVRFVGRLARPFLSFFQVVFNVIKGLLKASGTFSKIFRFIRPFIRFGTSLLGKLFIPLTVIISIFKGIFGFIDELRKGGDILDASLRAIGDILSFLTFGLIDADALKEFLGKPIREFIEGIKALFSEGFSIETLKKISRSLLKIIFAFPTIIIKGIGKLFAFILDKLGLDKTAEAFRTFFAKFNIGEMLANVFDPLIEVFAFIGKAIFKIGRFVFKINAAVVKFFIDIFKGVVSFVLKGVDFAVKIGQTIVDMFMKIVKDVTDFVNRQFEFLFGTGASEEQQTLRRQRRASLGTETAALIAETQDQATLDEAEKAVRAAKISQLNEEAAALAKQLTRKRSVLEVLFPANRQLEDEARQQAIAAINTQIVALSKGLQAGGIVSGPLLARVAEREAEAVIPLSRLDELVVNPAIMSALQMAEQMATNAGLRERRIPPPVVAPITNVGAVGGGGTAAIIPLPLSLRNNESTLRQMMMKDFRGAQL